MIEGGDEDTSFGWEFEKECFSYLFITYTWMRLLLSYRVRQKGIALLHEQYRTNWHLMHLYNILQGSILSFKKKTKEPRGPIIMGFKQGHWEWSVPFLKVEKVELVLRLTPPLLCLPSNIRFILIVLLWVICMAQMETCLSI